MKTRSVPGDASLQRLARRVIRTLAAEGASLATAESCTGGWIAKCLTDIPGSSDVFLLGLVTYANSAKQRQLGLSRAVLARHGAVSEPVARAMAQGALKAAGSSRSVAVTGVAGPAGGTPDKPVGTVWIAWARRGPGRKVTVTTRVFSMGGGREAIRRQAVAEALRGLLAR